MRVAAGMTSLLPTPAEYTPTRLRGLLAFRHHGIRVFDNLTNHYALGSGMSYPDLLETQAVVLPQAAHREIMIPNSQDLVVNCRSPESPI